MFLVKLTDSLLSYLESKGKHVHRVDKIFNILKWHSKQSKFSRSVFLDRYCLHISSVPKIVRVK